MANKQSVEVPAPPSMLVVIATVFIAIILAIAAFIFGQPMGSGTVPAPTGGLEEPPGLHTSPPDEGVACTLDAKLCPDGSAVGRVPPSCEFAPCPGE